MEPHLIGKQHSTKMYQVTKYLVLEIAFSICSFKQIHSLLCVLRLLSGSLKIPVTPLPAYPGAMVRSSTICGSTTSSASTISRENAEGADPKKSSSNSSTFFGSMFNFNSSFLVSHIGFPVEISKIFIIFVHSIVLFWFPFPNLQDFFIKFSHQIFSEDAV